MHITNEQLQVHQQQTQSLYSKYTKKAAAAKICGIVSPVLFILLSWTLTYCGILYLDRTSPLDEQVLTGLAFFNKFCDPIMTALQFGGLPWYIVVPLCFAAIILIPFAVNIAITLLVCVCGRGKKLSGLPAENVGKLKKLISCAEMSGKGVFNPLEDSRRLINWLYVLFLLIVFVYICIVLKVSLFMVFFIAVGFALMATALFWIYRLPLLAFEVLSGSLWTGGIKQASDVVKKMKGDFITEERLQREEKKQQKEAKKREIAAQKKKEAAAKRKAADAVYAQAIAGEEYDEELIEKAANMGSPDACLHHGKKLVQKWSTEHLTKAEKADIIKLAAAFLATSAPHSTEAEFLWIFARTQYESNSKEKWTSMLQCVRKLKASGKLPEEYAKTCELLLEALVEVIDATPETPAPKNNSSNSGNTSYFSGSYDPVNSAPLNSSDKWGYIRDNCHGMFSWSGIQTIENDPNLTASQKEDLKTYLKIYGD